MTDLSYPFLAEDLKITFTATYSAEDNKLRIYNSERTSTALYKIFVENGFKYAPKQKLFVKPSWTPKAEDFCLAIAGSIEPEQMTVAERAEFRAKRYDLYRVNRTRDMNVFTERANHLLSGGDVVLVGHHSERKALKAERQAETATKNANINHSKANYWAWQAEAVEHHANAKNDPRVRARRIKTLFADMRQIQRSYNSLQSRFVTWVDVSNMEDLEERNQLIKKLVVGRVVNQIENLERTFDEVISSILNNLKTQIDDPYYSRWLNHYLNRIGFETAMLGTVAPFEGELTKVILQTFCRTHGADKPTCSNDGNIWTVTSKVPLPVHLADSNTLSLNAGDWVGLMQSAGYNVPIKRITKSNSSPLLNFKAFSVSHKWTDTVDMDCEQVEMTKEAYKNIWHEDKYVRLSSCGTFRFRVFVDHAKGIMSNKRYSVFLTDSKVHEAPDSNAVIINKPKELKQA